MLKLITGTPGSGKTLNTIKMVRQQTLSKPNKVLSLFGTKPEPLPTRQVYYHGISDLNPDFGWIELNDDKARDWYNLPSGSIIIFDEAYNLFPTGSNKPPQHVKNLAVHRHKGFDIYLICQKVTGQIDPFVKGLINEHHHFERIFGSSMVNHFVWGRCESSIESRTARAESDHKITSLDSDYFGSYKSADVHTHKTRLPTNIIAVVFIAVAALVFAFRDGINPYADNLQSESKLDQSIPSTIQSSSPQTTSTQQSTPDDLSPEKYQPRVQDLPWTAPVYDHLRKPKSYPRIAGCIVTKSTGKCSCYSQQATIIKVPDFYCLQYVNDGVFDDQVPDTARIEDGFAKYSKK